MPQKMSVRKSDVSKPLANLYKSHQNLVNWKKLTWKIKFPHVVYASFCSRVSYLFSNNTKCGKILQNAQHTCKWSTMHIGADMVTIAGSEQSASQFHEAWILKWSIWPTRVEVWWWIFVRNAVKCGEKK